MQLKKQSGMVASSMLALMCVSGGVNAAVLSDDIAIIGNYMDGNSNTGVSGDAFAWVVLNNVGAGEILYFSDSSYRSGTATFIAEGLVQYTVPAGGLAAGTIMNFASGALPSGYVHVANTAYSDADIPSLTPSSSGDQLVIFQDDNVSNTAGFTGLWAVNNSSTGWGATGTSGTESDLYPGMTNGVNALALGANSGSSDEFDNVRYIGTTTGTAAEIRMAIQNLSNWERTNDGSADPVNWVTNGQSSFTIVPEPSSLAAMMFGAMGLVFRRIRK